jgi:hypothetical protein
MATDLGFLRHFPVGATTGLTNTYSAIARIEAKPVFPMRLNA